MNLKQIQIIVYNGSDLYSWKFGIEILDNVLKCLLIQRIWIFVSWPESISVLNAQNNIAKFPIQNNREKDKQFKLFVHFQVFVWGLNSITFGSGSERFDE